MKNSKILGLISVVSLLGACGSSSSPDVAQEDNMVLSLVDPVAVSQGENPAMLAATYNSTSDTLTVSDGTTDFVYGRNAGFENGTLRAYTRNAATGARWVDVAIFAETSTGSGTVAIINSTEDGFETATADLERIGITQLPTTGQTRYAGDYIGWLFDSAGADSVASGTIPGDAEITVDFATANVSGTISNRGRYTDITLDAASVANGAFSGTSTGGQSLGSATANGTYSGLLTGPDATEIIGSIIFDHSSSGAVTEVGTFIVEQ